jgi:hypothetical protein
VFVGTTTYAGSVVTATGDSKKVRLELTAAQTAAMSYGGRRYAVRAAMLDDDVITLVEGFLTARTAGN